MKEASNLFHSEVKKHDLRVFDAFLYLAEEQNGLSSVDDAMIIGERYVHHGSSHDLSTMNDWTNLSSMQAKDCTLWHVNDRSSHH